MPLILNIETATNVCSVALSDGAETLAIRESHEKNIHAAKVTTFTKEVCLEAGMLFNQLNAVAVSMGPGSYTGLRIGVSTAKGLCYALGIPLISVSTLQSMALAAAQLLENEISGQDVLFCPMIDARRMEVYTALFNFKNIEKRKVEALIIDENTFHDEREVYRIYYFGDGADKCRDIFDNKDMIYLEGIAPSAKTMATISSARYTQNKFENVAYFEPYYLKDFIAGKPKVKGLR
ncbi:MAG: tRNA (adenosine(37)-N6)-threonylcarbamoyltransferase complex dimerization subunit type 1 TsaB [Bacteroidales bacterium]|nr:tRNA (adenosine(37)-N6)-threonylcarbamoyltransferase complex dimerization subunit type 1 TsaB [Bacteroidales bacterium]